MLATAYIHFNNNNNEDRKFIPFAAPPPQAELLRHINADLFHAVFMQNANDEFRTCLRLSLAVVV